MIACTRSHYIYLKFPKKYIKMLPTPDYSHFTTKDYEEIYEPSEDTFLFIDAIEKDIELLNSINPLVALEIGPGSGIVINFLANNLRNRKQVLFYAADINQKACLATKEPAKKIIMI